MRSVTSCTTQRSQNVTQKYKKGSSLLQTTHINQKEKMYSKNRFNLYAIILFMFFGLVIASCTPEQPAQPTQNADTIYTLAALTNEAQQSTQTPLPTVTSVPTASEVPPTATPVRAVCTDSAELVNEDPLDNAAFKPGDKITKTWSLKNIGTCIWNNYRFVFDGKEMGGNSNAPVNQIAPGQTVDIYAYVVACFELENYCIF